ncbi:MAG TPA: hypothetical protein VEK78_11775 [Gemmatimonadales bacterium]|nr:hypothetical protein [Gemmatimonadales bacterium]
MTDKGLQKLRSLLKTYQEQAAGEPAESKPVHDEGEQRRRASAERLRSVVRSMLQDFMAELKNAGHEASVQDHTGTADAYPSVTLSFAPRAPRGSALASLLVFRYDPRRGVAVQRDIRPAATKVDVITTSTDRIGTIGVDAVSAAWVETKTLSFIEAVLRAN